MSTYKIEGKIAVVIENKKITKVKLRPHRKYISPDNKYAICIEVKERKELAAKLLLLTDNELSSESKPKLKLDGSLTNNTMHQNIALQELSAIFYIQKDKRVYKIVKFEYPSSL